LGKVLAKVAKCLKLGHRTPHGAQAVQRSQRGSDAVIAAEIGHTTGGSTLVEAYGRIPQNWYIADHPELTWLRSKGEPSWVEIPKQPAKEAAAETQKAA
jgi:hypothetical protein